MPNGYDLRKEYGSHKYADHGGTSNCEHTCGCWMGSSSSGGPLGVDPFGECPGNPKDGKPLGGKSDYEVVVKRRICHLERELFSAKELLKSVSPSKVKLAEEIESIKEELFRKEQILREIGEKIPQE